jgi:hypothetical protein
VYVKDVRQVHIVPQQVHPPLPVQPAVIVQLVLPLLRHVLTAIFALLQVHPKLHVQQVHSAYQEVPLLQYVLLVTIV